MGFRFETILKLNKNKEDILQKDLGKINTFIQKHQDNQNFIKEIIEEKKEDLNQKKRENINMQTMILYDNFFHGTQIHKNDRILLFRKFQLNLKKSGRKLSTQCKSAKHWRY